MSEQTGWIEDPARPPHRLLSSPLGTLRPESIVPAMVNGREMVVFTGPDEESLPVRFVDLESGALLPDRSFLHRPHLIALGRGAGRTLLTTVTVRGTVAVREAETGEPIGPAIHGPESPLAVAAGLVGGRELVAVCYRDESRVWDPADGAEVAAPGFGGRALVNHEGLLLAVSGGDGTWQLRDVRTGEAYGAPFPADGSIVAAVVHGGRVLVVSAGVSVRVWDVVAGAETTLPPLWSGGETGETSVRRLAFTPWDGGLAAVLTREGGRVELWLPGDAGPRRTALPDAETAAVLSHDGRLRTAVAGRSGALSVTGARSPYYGGPIRSFGGWAKRAGRMLAVLSGDPAMLYDVEAGRPFARLALPDYTPDSPVEVLLDGGGFRVGDTVRGRELLRRDGQHDADAVAVAVTAAGYRETDDQALLVTGGADGSVRVWNVSAGEPIGGPWHGHTGPVTAVALTRWRGQAVALSTDASGTARMWVIGGPVRHAGHTGRVNAVAGGVRAGRPVFASGGEDGTIRFWDPVTGAGVGAPIPCSPVGGLVFAGDILVSSGTDGVRRWNPATGASIGEHLPGSGGLATAELDGRALVAAVAGERLRVWDAATGEPHTTMPLPGPAALQDLDVHDGRLLALTVSDPDKGLFPEAACQYGRQITIWDVPAAEPLLPPMLTSDDGGHGAFGRVGGRLMAAHGVDARTNDEDDEGVWPEEEGDIYLRDLTTGELGADFRPEAGLNQQLLITRVRDDDVVLVAAESAVVTWHAATGHQAAPPVKSLTGSITCVAAVEAEGRTYAAAGDWAGTVRIWEIMPRP
jgi:WD40 repeat protein